jgi:AcrR family transcriptional regulator
MAFSNRHVYTVNIDTIPGNVSTVNFFLLFNNVMRAKSETSYHHGNLRRALIKEALAMIAENGSASLSLRELARRVGVTPTAPYRHFVDREALLATVAEEGYRLMKEKLDAGAEESDAIEALNKVGAAYLEFARTNPSHYRVMFGPFTARNKQEEKYPELKEIAGEVFKTLVDVIERGQAQGTVRPGSSAELAESSWAMVHGLSSLLIDGHIGSDGYTGSTSIVEIALDYWGDALGYKPS